MKTHVLFFVVMFCFTTIVFATNESSNSSIKVAENSTSTGSMSRIAGVVIDQKTGEKLAGVEVKIYNTNVSYYTDLDGKFEIPNVQNGANAIIFKTGAYQQKINNILINSNQETKLKIELSQL